MAGLHIQHAYHLISDDQGHSHLTTRVGQQGVRMESGTLRSIGDHNRTFFNRSTTVNRACIELQTVFSFKQLHSDLSSTGLQ